MSYRSLAFFAAAAALTCMEASFAFAGPAPGAAYSMAVRLPDGKALSCAVNEPLSEGISRAALSTTEQRQADVLATQPLRLLSGPSSDYPTPYTAPHVVCAPA